MSAIDMMIFIARVLVLTDRKNIRNIRTPKMKKYIGAINLLLLKDVMGILENTGYLSITNIKAEAISGGVDSKNRSVNVRRPIIINIGNSQRDIRRMILIPDHNRT
jgi:hypothetical protein